MGPMGGLRVASQTGQCCPGILCFVHKVPVWFLSVRSQDSARDKSSHRQLLLFVFPFPQVSELCARIHETVPDVFVDA